MEKFWVDYQDLTTQVSTENCKNIDDFIEAVRKRLAELNITLPPVISLSLELNGAPLALDLELNYFQTKFESFENTASKPLYVSVKGK